jgi:zinc protease
MSSKIVFRLVAVAAAVIVAASVFVVGQADTSTALPAGVQRGPSVEGITEYKLDNGLEVLLFPDPTKQTTTVNITYLVGSRNENYGETGMAHLLEHLMFKGSTSHPNIPDELTSHGARPNASTSYDRTNYFETFAATDENLDWALDLEADRMVNSFIAKKDLDSEMTVVRNEFEAGENEPGAILFERVMSTAYLWHNYGKSTIGARADIENVPIDRLQAFWRNYYQPDNSVLLVAGKLDEAKTLALIAKKFGAIPKATRVPPKTYTVDPTQDGERSVTLRRVGDTQQVLAAYHIPAGSHADAPAVDVLAYILGDTPSGRLHKALVETKKAASVFAFGYGLREPGIMMCGAEVLKEASLDSARDALLSVVEGAPTVPATAEEVERAKTAILKDIELSLNDPNRVGLQMSEWLALGDWRLFFLNRDRVRAVKPEDVQRVATVYLKPSNRTLGLFIPTEKPDRAEVPATPDVAALVMNYKGGQAVAAGEAFDPSPANIETRTTRKELKGGLKLAVLTKKTRGNTINASIRFNFGDLAGLKGKDTASDLAGSMLMRGSSKHTRQQIQDELDKLKVRAFVGGSATSAFVSIEATREQFPAALRLLAEVLREPVFPQSEFEQLKQEELAAIESSKSDPQAKAFQAFRRHLYPYPADDPRYVATPEESIERIKSTTLDAAKRFHKDFYGGSSGQVAVVGDFEAKDVEALVQELFGTWKSPKKYERIAAEYKDIAATSVAIETPDKANAVFTAGMRMPIRQDDPDYPALALGNFMTGGGFLNSRLAARIRQKDGLSYDVGSQLGADPLDKDGSFTGFAIYAPENADKLEAAFKEEIAKILDSGFTAEEIAQAKTGWIQGRQVGRTQDRNLASALSNYLYLGRTFKWDADLEAKVQALTPEQIKLAMKKWIDPSKFTYVRAGDFSGAKAKAAKKEQPAPASH